MPVRKFFRLVVLIILVNGCVSGTITLRGHENLHREDAAILRGQAPCTPNWAFNLDMPDKPNARATYDICGLEGCREFLLPAGRYDVFYSCKGGCAGTVYKSFKFFSVALEAGHSYKLERRGWIKERAVLIDANTRKEVSVSL